MRTKAVGLGNRREHGGHKDVLGLRITQTEGAKFWLQVGIFTIACVDGLKGLPEAIEAVYPKAAVQLCIVHMVRNSVNYLSWKL